MKIIGIAFLVVLAFAIGAWNGWDNGVQDGRNLYSCQTGE